MSPLTGTFLFDFTAKSSCSGSIQIKISMTLKYFVGIVFILVVGEFQRLKKKKSLPFVQCLINKTKLSVLKFQVRSLLKPGNDAIQFKPRNTEFALSSDTTAVG